MSKIKSIFAALNTKNECTMATMTIEYNPANALVQPVLELIHRIKDFKIISTSEDELVPNAETIEAFKEVEEGKTHRYKSTEDMFNKILGKSYVRN